MVYPIPFYYWKSVHCLTILHKYLYNNNDKNKHVLGLTSCPTSVNWLVSPTGRFDSRIVYKLHEEQILS